MLKQFCLLLFVFSATMYAEENSSIYSFYKNPTVSNFQECLTDVSDYLSNPQVEDCNKTAELSNGATFAAQVFKKYPQYIETCMNKLPLLSFYEKALVLRGMNIAEISHPVLASLNDEKLKELVFSPAKTLSEIDQLKISDPADFDSLWVSYFATGDKRFIRQIYQYINSCSRSDLLYAYEFINRNWMTATLSKLMGAPKQANLDDWYQALRNESNSDADYQKHLDRINTICAAMWQLDSNIKQDSSIKNLTERLLKENPSLDWWPKVKM